MIRWQERPAKISLQQSHAVFLWRPLGTWRRKSRPIRQKVKVKVWCSVCFFLSIGAEMMVCLLGECRWQSGSDGATSRCKAGQRAGLSAADSVWSRPEHRFTPRIHCSSAGTGVTSEDTEGYWLMCSSVTYTHTVHCHWDHTSQTLQKILKGTGWCAVASHKLCYHLASS